MEVAGSAAMLARMDASVSDADGRTLANDLHLKSLQLRRIDAEYFLVATRVCPPPLATGGMDLVYSDAGAQLWRVQASSPHLR